MRRSIHVISLPKALNCTRPQAQQLLDERVLLPLSGGPANAPGRTQKAVDTEEIAAFLEALRSNARPVDAAPPKMVPIAKAAKKAKASSVAVVHLILAGFLENVVRLAEVEGYGGILVDPAEVRAEIRTWLPSRPPRPSPPSSFRSRRDGRWHIEVDNPFRSIVIEGRNGRHRFYRFDETEVTAFRSRFTTIVRVANAMDVQRYDVATRPKGAGVRPILSRREIGLDLYRVEDLPDPCLMT